MEVSEQRLIVESGQIASLCSHQHESMLRARFGCIIAMYPGRTDKISPNRNHYTSANKDYGLSTHPDLNWHFRKTLKTVAGKSQLSFHTASFAMRSNVHFDHFQP